MTHNTPEMPASESNITENIGAQPSLTYVPAAPLIDVLFEQLDYLLSHVGSCMPDCADCGRLEQVKRSLLQPFGI
jgi:hypothetical protein